MMRDTVRRRPAAAGALSLALALAVVGCGGEEPKSTAEPVEITPAMENMKQEMMKNLKATPAGRKAFPKGCKAAAKS